MYVGHVRAILQEMDGNTVRLISPRTSRDSLEVAEPEWDLSCLILVMFDVCICLCIIAEKCQVCLSEYA